MTTVTRHTVARSRPSGTPRVCVSGASLDAIGVSDGGRIKALDGGDSVLLVPGDQHATATVLAEYGVNRCTSNLKVDLFSPALEPLGVSPGDVIEARPCPVGVRLVRGDSS